MRKENKMLEILSNTNRMAIEINTENVLKLLELNILPIYITKQVMKRQKIRMIRENKKMPENGRVIIGKEEFVIEINSKKCIGKANRRYLIAHEVAHTMLYEIEKWPPRNMIVKISERKYEETICDYLARKILIPEETLKREIIKEVREHTTYEKIKKIANKYCVPWSQIVIKLVEDMRYIKKIIMIAGKKSDNDGWRVKWHAMPKMEGIYIPIGRRIGDKYYGPKIKGVIKEIIEKVKDGKEESIKEEIEIERIKDRYMSSIKAYKKNRKEKTLRLEVSKEIINKQIVIGEKEEKIMIAIEI